MGDSKFLVLIVPAVILTLLGAPPSSALPAARSSEITLPWVDPAGPFQTVASAEIAGGEAAGDPGSDEAAPTPSPGSGLSKAKALVLSTALPGAGQYYAGNKTRAKAFFIAEAAIWTGFVVFRVQGHLRKDSYVEFAGLMASVDAEGKSDDFYRALGLYMRSDPGPGSYNEDIRREARALYPDDRQKQEQYLLENGYFGADSWEWQSEEDQVHYRDLRKNSVRSFERATYMLGLALANRVIAAMDATRSVAKTSKSEPQSLGLRFEMRPDPVSPSTLLLCLTKDF